MQRIFYFFILFLPSILWATPKLAILPFSHNDRITERYYLLMYSTFSKTVEADPGYSLMGYDDTVNAIKEAGLTEKQLLTSSDAAVFGKALGVDFVIYGNIALNTTTLPLPRGFTISNYVMNVFMADVETGHLLNHVAGQSLTSLILFNFRNQSRINSSGNHLAFTPLKSFMQDPEMETVASTEMISGPE